MSLNSIVPRFELKLTLPRNKPSQYAKELKAYKTVLKEYRARNQQQYWTAQTKIEDKYIEKFNQDALKQKHEDHLKFLTSIIKVSRMTMERQKENEKQTEERNSRIKSSLVQEDVKKINRQRILQVLREESRDWVTTQNIDEKINDEMLIPSSVYDETDYYLRLHQEALYYQEGDFQGLEKLGQESEIISYQNKLLIPKYQEVISCIKHLKSSSPISKLTQEYDVANSLLEKDQVNFSNAEFQRKREELENAYRSLILAAKEDLAKPRKQIQFLRDQLYLLYNMLSEWREYTQVLMLPNSTIENMMKSDHMKYNAFGHDEAQFQNLYVRREEQVNNEPLSKQQQNLQNLEEDLFTAEESETDIEGINKENQVNIGELAKNQEIMEASQKLNKQKLEKEISNSLKKQRENQTLNQDQKQTVNIESEQSLAFQIEKIFQKHENDESADEAQFEREFEQLKIKNSLENLKNARKGEEQPADPRELYRGLDLDSVFPNFLTKSIGEFSTPNLKFSSVDAIIENEVNQNISKIRKGVGEVQMLQTNIVVEVFKENIEELKNHAGKELSRKDINKLQKVSQLLKFLGELSIEEPQFLLKVWNSIQI